MYSKNSKGYTLVEIIVVLVIMGFLVALVSPKFAGVIETTSGNLNKSQMQEIKRATLEFYKDVGFVPDNVTLLTYPWGKCTVKETNFDDGDSSDACKNMIAFIDKHYKYDDTSIRDNDNSMGDNGKNTKREKKLMNIIQEKLNPSIGWKGGYIGANSYIQSKNVKRLGYDGASGYENDNLYFFSDLDLKLYDGNDDDDLYSIDASKWDLTTANAELYPIYAADFNGSQHSVSSRLIQMDALYENAKYSKDANGDGDRKDISDYQEVTLLGQATILDSYGTPYEIQIPTKSAVGSEVRTRYARIVSFGKDRRRDTPIDKLDLKDEYKKTSYDDSVLYIFDTNQTSYFHPEDKEK